MKKQLYSAITLGSLTDSVFILVCAAPFILFFWVKEGLGGWRDHSPFGPFCTQVCFPFCNTSGKEKSFVVLLFSDDLCLGPSSIYEVEMHLSFLPFFYLDENLEMKSCTIPSFLVEQSFSCGLGMLDVCFTSALVISGLFVVGAS